MAGSPLAASPEPQGSPIPGEAGRSPSQARSVVQLASGQIVTMVVLVGTMPIISRQYVDDQSWTIYGIVVAIGMCLQPVCRGFCYSLAMPLATTVSERRDVFALSMLLGFISVAVLTLAVWLVGPSLALAFGKPEVGPYLMYVPALCLFNVIGSGTLMTLSCEKRFAPLALRAGLMGVVRSAVQIAAGFVAATRSATGLLLGALAAAYVNAVPFSQGSVRALWRRSDRPLCWAGLVGAARRFKGFFLFRFWTETLTQAAENYPMLFLGFVFPYDVGKSYLMARSLLLIPVRLFAYTSRSVFYIEAAERVTEGESASKATLEILSLLTMLTAFPLTAVLVLGPLLFEIALGPDWYEAGVYAQLMMPLIAISVLAQPLSAMFDATSRLGEGLVYNLLLLVLQAAAMGLGCLFWGPRIVLVLYTAANVVVCGTILIRVLGLAGAGRKPAAWKLVVAYAEALVRLLPAGVLYWLAHMPIAALAALALASLAYAALLDRREPRARQWLRRVLRRRPRREGE